MLHNIFCIYSPFIVGALFAAVATIETLCTLCGASIFNSLYSISVRQFNFKGFSFLVMAALMIIPSVIIG